MKLTHTCLLALAGVTLASAAQADTIYSEGFEDLANSGWILTNNSSPAGTSWLQGANEIFTAQAGGENSYALANYLSANGSGSISNWLISPEITLAAGSTLSFYARTEDTAGYQDAFNVYFSAGSASTTSSFTALATAVTAQNGWTLYTFALPDAATGRIAFEYSVANADNANVLGIDSVQISAVPEPSTYGLMALGLVGMAALRRRRSAE